MVGKDLLIAVGGVIVAAQRSCTLNMDVDTIEVCSPVDGAWKKHIPTTIGWQVQCAGLIYNPEHADALIEAISKREMVRISFYDHELRMLRSGYAIMTTLEEGGSIGDMASQSMQFLGSGELEKVSAVDVEYTDSYTVSSTTMEDNDNHAYVMSSGGTVTVKEITLGSASRLSIAIGRGRFVLYSADDFLQIQTLIYNKENIKLYANNEIAHYVYGGENEPVVLAKGKYYVACNSNFESWFSLTAVSIPVN